MADSGNEEEIVAAALDDIHLLDESQDDERDEGEDGEYRHSDFNVVAELSEEEEDLYFDEMLENLREQKQRREKGESVIVPDSAHFEVIGISGHEIVTDGENRKICVFTIEIRCNEATPSFWVVYRRYTQFRHLSESLLAQGFAVPPLPPKIVLGAFLPEFNVQRKGALNEWLQQLFACNLPASGGGGSGVGTEGGQTSSVEDIHLWPKNLHRSPELRAFLCAEANIPPYLVSLRGDAAEGSNVDAGGDDDASRTPTDDQSTDTGGGRSLESRIRKVEDGPRVGAGDFSSVKVIGRGAFGTVLLVQKKDDGRYFAMKVLAKAHIDSGQQKTHTRTERRVLGTINHPFIVKLYYAFQTRKRLFLVLDYAAGGELFFHLSRFKKFPQIATCFYCAEITMALDALHKLGVLYRDLKPENILLDREGHIKLADFGLAKENVTSASTGAHSLCGTIQYVSPEVLGRSPKGHGTAVDWWNLGMVTYEMLTGLPPWYSTNTQQMLHDIMNAPLHTLHFPPDVGRDPASFIFRLLQKRPEDRLGSERGGADVMAHPFFKGIDWGKMYNRQYAPPFNPCRKAESETEANNFEKDFTSAPVTAFTSDDNLSRGGERAARVSEDTACTNYSDFTFSIDAAASQQNRNPTT